MTAITGAGTTLFSASSLFDKLDRLSTRTLTGGAYTQTTAYAYEWGTTLPQSVTVNGSTISYTYDEAGNITTITDGSLVTYYTYDSLNQLVREDNAYSNKTVVYAYDNGGNILTKTEYPYSPTVADITALTPTNTVTYTYGNADWKDQLTSFNGEAITYDAIGNPLTYRGMTLTWQNGRQLATLSKAGLTASYVYNDEGLRTKKTVNGITTEYYWNGSQLLGQKTGDSYLYFLYDERGLLVGFNDGIKTYLYTRNLQGDIIAITDTSTGTVVATYIYDSWGNVLTATGTMAEVNPFRYRGYYYDSETELYYLQSRYYDAEVGRFLNVDAQLNASLGVLGYNVFAYCLNNFISKIDNSGNKPGDLFNTMDEAAKDFAYYINEQSIKEDREYGSFIYSVQVVVTRIVTYPDIFGNNIFSKWWNRIFNGGRTKTVVKAIKITKYSYVAPKRGGTHGVSIPRNWFWLKKKEAEIHTHGAYNPRYKNDQFSAADLNDWINYLVTPLGTVRKYNPYNGSDIIIFDDVPYDPNHPGKK